MFGTIRDVLRTKGSKVHMARDTALAGEAVTLLNRLCIGSLVVSDGYVRNGYGLVGMFTERDVLTRLVAERRDPWATSVREVMSRPLVTIGPRDTLEHAMQLMTRRRVRHLPVVDGPLLLGLVSQGDLTAHIQRELQRDINDLSSYVHGPVARPSEHPPKS